MQNIIKMALFLFFFILFAVSKSYAGVPVWTFTTNPYYPPQVSITPNGTATIKYIVTNQSQRSHTLVMQPITGITQITTPGNCSNPFTLAYNQACTLNLLVNGSALNSDVHGGPIVCQQGSTLQCYQPTEQSILTINRIPLANYLITISALANGTVTPSPAQTVLAGSNLTFTATPNANYSVAQWIVDAGIAQTGGATFTLSNILANHTVQVTFTQQGTRYAGAANGHVYFSTNYGSTWTATTAPSPGMSVNAVFATATTLYVGSNDGKVYSSTNNGSTWTATSSPDGSAVNGVFVTKISNVSTIFAVTQNGNVYYTTDGITWTLTAIPSGSAINSIFITAANVIYVGSSDGNVYYSTNLGTSWNTMTGPALMSGMSVQNVFVAANQLYINTRHSTGGTVDFEYAFTSNSLTSPTPTWTLFSQITYTLFVSADAQVIDAGTQGGYVYSLTTGDELGFVVSSPITSLFFLA